MTRRRRSGAPGEVTPSDGTTFLATAAGDSFTVDGFGNRFRKWCNEAGLPHCSAHGLRKAAAARLAEIGCTEHEIMAVTGHKSLKEVSRYTRAARQNVLAASGMAKFAEDQTPRDQRLAAPDQKSNVPVDPLLPRHRLADMMQPQHPALRNRHD